jgi:hypothetical protein
MRTVTQKIKAAFESGKRLTVSNTMTDGTAVFLHGNRIIEKRADGIYWTLAGWNTATTRERVNGIALYGSADGVCQKNYAPVIRNSETGSVSAIGASEWFKATV